MERGIKAVITPGMLFEALGFRYFGPINGHNIVKLVEIFRHTKELNGPILIHVITEKGKGYAPAEREVTRLHGVTPFDKITGVSPKENGLRETYTDVFGKALVEICTQNAKVIGVTAAMSDGTGLIHLHEELPQQFFDVGIAEQHAVTFAAGMATEGYIPVVAIYSTFLQRAFDQVVHDCAIQKLHVVLAMDRGGLVGADGATHHGALDFSFLRCIPGMVIMAPKDEQELRDMLYTAVEYTQGPIAFRYPRGNVQGVPVRAGFQKLEIGKAETLRSGTDIALLAIGSMVPNALKAADLLGREGIEAEVVNMRFAKPVDRDLLQALAKRIQVFLTIEEDVIHGGFGAGVLEAFSHCGVTDVSIKLHGLPDEFIEQGSPAELNHIVKLDGEGIAQVAKEFLTAARVHSASHSG
jgi:1-deoxy-D-xylulose-5-phosphate synthase